MKVLLITLVSQFLKMSRFDDSKTSRNDSYGVFISFIIRDNLNLLFVFCTDLDLENYKGENKNDRECRELRNWKMCKESKSMNEFKKGNCLIVDHVCEIINLISATFLPLVTTFAEFRILRLFFFCSVNVTFHDISGASDGP